MSVLWEEEEEGIGKDRLISDISRILVPLKDISPRVDGLPALTLVDYSAYIFGIVGDHNSSIENIYAAKNDGQRITRPF